MERLFAAVKLASILIAAAAVTMLLRVPEPRPEEAVRRTFAEYQHAVLAGDGETAAALLSPGTIAWYGKVLDLAQHGSRADVEHLNPLEELQVLVFRQRVPADELRAMSPRELVAYSIRQGWIGKAIMQGTDIGAITVSNDTAVAEVRLRGNDTGQRYHFVDEGGHWLFNYLPTIQAGAEALQAAVEQRGTSVDAFVQQLVEAASGKKVVAELWQPPFPRPTVGAP